LKKSIYWISKQWPISQIKRRYIYISQIKRRFKIDIYIYTLAKSKDDIHVYISQIKRRF
jgi:hypothetical protein